MDALFSNNRQGSRLHKEVLKSKLTTQKQIVQDKKEYHLKRLQKLSEKTIGAVPWLDEAWYEQKQWVLFRLSHGNTWPKVHDNKIGDSKNWK